MDGRIVKKDTVGRGMRLVVPSSSNTTGRSDEEPSNILSCIRGEKSQGDRAVSVEGGSWGTEDGEGDRASPLGSDQVRGRPSGGLNEGSESTLADVWGGELRKFWGPDVPARETECAVELEARDCCRNSYAHTAPLLLFAHAVQGCLASHFWWGRVSPRFP